MSAYSTARTSETLPLNIFVANQR
ncbi:hypothetical protein CUJ84_pRLN2000105 (plasmid) [Rhizobium leguminosarum]|uniref:Uncharacterized protein n=1 Tax=Rhizobium leguminosarum TaxID=384 RepID=A0A2K9ZEI1_RHILE|nr:hypothetical protein CUJ84_pRLN2000105 [Rhizobium leguminosarum]